MEKIMIRTRILTLVFCLLLPVSAFSQTAAASRSWNAYWTKFSAAINSKNKAAVKSMMVAERDFDSPGGETRDQWLASVDWSDLKRSVRRGVKFHSYDGKPGRISKDNFLLFEYTGGRWKFIGVQVM